jgi:hypothetical protein
MMLVSTGAVDHSVYEANSKNEKLFVGNHATGQHEFNASKGQAKISSKPWLYIKMPPKTIRIYSGVFCY